VIYIRQQPIGTDMTAPTKLGRRPLLLGGLAFATCSVLPHLPASAAERIVYDASQLKAALAAAQPGDLIVLAPGCTFAGDFVVSRSGTQQAPITIACGTVLGATITGSFTLAGADIVLAGSQVKKGIVLKGDRTRASRCKIDASGTNPGVTIAKGTGCVVEFCEVRNHLGRGIRADTAARQARIYRNWVHDQGTPANPLAVANIIIGVTGGTSATVTGAKIVENLVEKAKARQAIECKASGNVLEGNTVVGTAKQPGDLLVRFGTDNVFLRNWVENGRLLLCDKQSIAVGNRCTGSLFKPCIGVKAGTSTADEMRSGGDTGAYLISEDARLIANESAVHVGWRYSTWSVKPRRTQIEIHDRSRFPVAQTLADPGEVTYADGSGWNPMPAAVKRLVPSDVGPLAAG
jgi:hypothetical protein